jgi:YidC/Oxa1 family membrane protein insertase
MENNRRFLLALALSALALFAFQFLFPTPPAKPVAARPVPAAAAGPASVGAPAAASAAVAAAANDAGAAPAASPAAAAVETVTVTGARAAYRVSAQGAALVGAEMRGYRHLDADDRGQPVQLARPGEALLTYRVVVPGDTIPLARVPFSVTRTGAGGAEVVRMDGVAQGRVAQNGVAPSVPVSITYAFAPDSYTVRVRGSVQAAGPAFLLVDLPQTLAATERDTADHFNQLSFAWKPKESGAKGETFGGLDAGERVLAPGPLTWAVTKSKYFLVGALTPAGGQPFSELAIEGGPRTSKVATRARGTLVVPVANGAVGFDVYAGPQEWRRLAAQGRAFEESNPYGGWLQGIVQPFATMAIRAILWMHDTLRLGYGWVLVGLGVLVRLVLWPLQQNMMRNQLKMQRVQPEIQLVQQRYKTTRSACSRR